MLTRRQNLALWALAVATAGTFVYWWATIAYLLVVTP